MLKTVDNKADQSDTVDYALRFAFADDYGLIDRPVNASVSAFTLGALLPHLSFAQRHDIYALLDDDGCICGASDPQAVNAILSALSALHDDFVAPTFEHGEHLEVLVCTE